MEQFEAYQVRELDCFFISLLYVFILDEDEVVTLNGLSLLVFRNKWRIIVTHIGFLYTW